MHVLIASWAPPQERSKIASTIYAGEIYAHSRDVVRPFQDLLTFKTLLYAFPFHISEFCYSRHDFGHPRLHALLWPPCLRTRMGIRLLHSGWTVYLVVSYCIVLNVLLRSASFIGISSPGIKLAANAQVYGIMLGR